MKIKRIYETPEAEDGYRVLVDRIWPRGISKDNAALDEWMKDIAPSTELRKWFNHQPELFPEFKRKYKEELKEKKMELNHLKSIAAKKNLTLLYSAKDTQFNQAVVLLDALNK
ncbi:MAG: hypothetical protein RJA25_1251 [Bacteroidota bacterium]|jgi:uncharacterized protein YeaO (DUF488 family)